MHFHRYSKRNMKFLAKDYNARVDLEKAVRNSLGFTADLKLDSSIEGTQAELKRLFLSETTIFWGIKCVATDPDPPSPVVQKPNRGKIHPSGIDNNVKLPKNK